MEIMIKEPYKSINGLDKKLCKLEAMAEKNGYNIDNDELYIEMCTMLTDAEFEGRKRIACSFWNQLYNIVLYRAKGEI